MISTIKYHVIDDKLPYTISDKTYMIHTRAFSTVSLAIR